MFGVVNPGRDHAVAVICVHGAFAIPSDPAGASPAPEPEECLVVDAPDLGVDGAGLGGVTSVDLLPARPPLELLGQVRELRLP